MKKLILMAILLPGCMGLAYAQTTIILQPDASAGKDAFIRSPDGTTNYGTSANYAAIAWTEGGVPFISRALLAFDLTSIPTNATITNAKLSLYCNTTSDHSQLHSSLSGSNSSYLQNITSSWSENTVTWNNQPSTTTLGQITLPQSASSTQDYTNIDIASLVQGWVSSPSSNYGVMLSLVTEAYYRSLIFASSDHGDSTKRPKLEICYAIYDDAIEFSKRATGLNSKTNSSFEFQLYPNPTNGSATVEFYNPSTGNVSCRIYNIKGDLVENSDMGVLQTGNQSFEIIDSSLEKGIYFINLNINGMIYYKKLVVL